MEEACEDTPNCVAVCVEGGPVSRVEEYMMDEIVRNVHVMGAGGTRLNVHIAVKRVTFEELQREVREVLKPPPRPREHNVMSAAPEPAPVALPAAMAKGKHELRQMLAIRMLTREECLAQLQALPMSETEALEWLEGVD